MKQLKTVTVPLNTVTVPLEVNTYYVLSFLIMLSCSFTLATYVPFLIWQGMTLKQIGIISASFIGISIISEPPTGGFADKFGRHYSIVISCFLAAIGEITYFYAHNFWLFIISEVLVGIGRSFASGALESWMVDSINARNCSHMRQEIIRKGSYLNNAGMIIGCVSGSLVACYNMAWPFLLGAITATITGIYSLKLKECYAKNEFSADGKVDKRKQESIIKKIKFTFSKAVTNNKIAALMLMSAILSLAVSLVNLQWTVLFQRDYHLETKYLGLMFAAFVVFDSIGAYFSKKRKFIFKEEKQILASVQALTAIMIIGVSLVSGFIMALAFFLLHESGRGAFKPLKNHFLHNHIEENNRASMMSLESMISKFGNLIGLLIGSLIVGIYSIKFIWLFSGIFLLLSALIYLLPKKSVAT